MSEWFLPRHERAWTEGNLVLPLVHGAAYFARLVEVVQGAAAGDEVFAADWRGDADELLGPDGPTAGELLCQAARRGVHVRCLIWRSHSDRLGFSAKENRRLGTLVNEAGGLALLDQRVRRGGSHHQKVVVVRHRGQPERDVAFVGGIDLCHSRRDDDTHQGDPQAQPMDPRYGAQAPWHDAMVELRGPAVCDVLATFAERWNDPTPLDRTPYRRLVPQETDVAPRAEPLREDVCSPVPPAAGRHQVQLLRTYGPKRPPFPFAPRGERTVARGYARAFARAERLIYIEDQYLWSDVVAGTLATALRRAPRLQVIAVVPRFPDQDGAFTGPPNRVGQLRSMSLLRDAGGDRFQVFDVSNAAGTPVYVHAKVCVVDDAWATCGSDNFNRRSWTHDSELTCAMGDPDGELPRRLRSQLWAEHLGLEPHDPRLGDLDGAAALWRGYADLPGVRVLRHEPAPVGPLTRLWAEPLYRLVYDPDGRPLRMRRAGRF